MNRECAKCVMTDVCTYYPNPPAKSPCRYAIHAEAVVDSSLTKREQFAVGALQGLCASSKWPLWKATEMATSAVSLADALIEELNK